MKPFRPSFMHKLQQALMGAMLALIMTANVSSAEPPVPPYPVGGPPNPADIPPGYTIIEGDIQIPLAYLSHAPSSVWATNFWTNGIIPYEFDANVASANQTAMLQAMNDWEAVANIDFRARAGDANYVHIQNSTGNNSAVGMQGGMQIINIFNWDMEFVMAHELGHCLALWHEHTRADRDSFILVNWSNIQTDYRPQFNLNSSAGHYGPYDFDSVMHYDQCAFSIDCPAGWTCNCTHTVITVLPPHQAWQTLIGQRNHLSNMDQLTMSFLYPQSDWRFVDSAYTGGTENGTFLTPYKQFPPGFTATPSGGTLWVQPGTYSSVGTYNNAVTIRAALGNVTLGQ